MSTKSSYRQSWLLPIQLAARQAFLGLLAVGGLLFAGGTWVVPRWDFGASDCFVHDDNTKSSSYDLYPPEILASEWADEVPRADLVHLSLPHEACLTFRNDVIPWTYT